MEDFFGSVEPLVPGVYLSGLSDFVEVVDDVFPDRVHHLDFVGDFGAGLGVLFFGAEPLQGRCGVSGFLGNGFLPFSFIKCTPFIVVS